MASYKFEESYLKEFEYNVTIGLYPEHAAALVFNIDRRTFYRWRSDQSPLEKEEKSLLELAISKGVAKRTLRLVKVIQKCISDGDGRLGLKLLQGLEPKKYSERGRLENFKEEKTQISVQNEGVIVLPPLDQKSKQSDNT